MTAKLFKALRDGNIDELEELIAKGAQVNEADKKGYTPLIECASQGFAEGISVLLTAGLTEKQVKN
jgi:ankyrin repeat protein